MTGLLRNLFALGIAAFLSATSTAAQVMPIADYTASMWQRQFSNEEDKNDLVASQVSASVDNIVAACTRLIERGTADPDVLAFVRVKRARVYLTLNLRNAAYDDFERALMQAWVGKTFVLLALAEAEGTQTSLSRQRAMQLFDNAISLSPSDPTIVFRRGLWHRKADLPEQAAQDFGATIKLAPTRASAYIQRAEVYRAGGDVTRAEQDYHAAFDRADKQFVRGAQSNLNARQLYKDAVDGTDRPSFRAALDICIRDAACQPIESWSSDIQPDRP